MEITCKFVPYEMSFQVSTIDCMVKNVLANWRSRENRDCLHDFGYAGLFYITLASYLEHYIRRRITVRIKAYLDIKDQNPVDEDCQMSDYKFGTIDCIVDDVVELRQVDFRDYNNIARVLSTKDLVKVEKINRNGLFNVYLDIFHSDVNEIIESTLLEEWDALVVIRNTYAHGADLISIYDGMNNKMVKDSFYDTASGKRLNEQRTVENTEIMPFICIFTERVMRHYYVATQQIIKRLDEATTNPAERIKFDNLGIKPLPDLP